VTSNVKGDRAWNRGRGREVGRGGGSMDRDGRSDEEAAWTEMAEVTGKFNGKTT